MNNRFLNSLQYNNTRTENNMPTHSTSGSALVDLFFTMGASRNLSESRLTQLFDQAFVENPLYAVKAVFYNRDIRGGQGERRSFRIFFNHLCKNYTNIAVNNLDNVVKYGRWDDLFSGLDTPAEKAIIVYIYDALVHGDKLCAKWMPREGKSNSRIAKKLMSSFGLNPKQYRKLLAGNTNVVETQMANRDWNKIIYEHVPSVAMKNYRKAFGRHDFTRFDNFLNQVMSGETKINSATLFPHDIVRNYLTRYYSNSVDKTLEAQWNSLPNYVPEGKSMIPVCDVSGSMNGTPMEVSIGLGIYLAERNKGPFQNGFITFSGNPTLQMITGKTLKDKVTQLLRAHWEMNTNLERVFELILNSALRDNLSNEEIPSTILILSDMQFDQCVRSPNQNAMEMIENMYGKAGYTVPNVVFWNLRTSSGVSVKFDKTGAALVSGYSPSIMKNIFNGVMTPMNIVVNTLNSERYSTVII